MIYVTGDTHGKFKRVKDFCERFQTSKEDILIILGDASINYHLNERNRLIKRYLATLPITLLCVHGNHEARPFAINTYREIEWHGGKAYIEDDYPSIIFAKDGEIYCLNGKRTLVVGGAYSVDKWFRIAVGLPWFENEQPDEEIKFRVENNLERACWNVDVVLSHTCPLKYLPTEAFLTGINQESVDQSTEIWLDSLEQRLTYKRWYCGHFHIEKSIDKLRFMFNDIAVFE